MVKEESIIFFEVLQIGWNLKYDFKEIKDKEEDSSLEELFEEMGSHEEKFSEYPNVLKMLPDFLSYIQSEGNRLYHVIDFTRPNDPDTQILDTYISNQENLEEGLCRKIIIACDSPFGKSYINQVEHGHSN